MSVVAAPLTASRSPVGGERAPRPRRACRRPCVKSPKPTIITMVASAAGIESLRMSQVRLREMFDQRTGW